MKHLTSSLLVLLVVVMAGCAQSGKPSYPDTSSSPFIRANHQAAEMLLEQMPNSGNTMLIATLVNVDELDRSSTLGRLVSEQISARFTQAGQRMVEMKLRNNVYISQTQGELMLTRELHELAGTHNAQAVIVGSYGEGRDHVFINLKVIEPSTNVVLATHDYALPISDDVRVLLGRPKRF